MGTRRKILRVILVVAIVAIVVFDVSRYRLMRTPPHLSVISSPHHIAMRNGVKISFGDIVGDSVSGGNKSVTCAKPEGCDLQQMLDALDAQLAIPSRGVIEAPTKIWGELPAKPIKPERWEHGWKTEHVTATRYGSARIGYSIGFAYPLNPNDCDRADFDDFMRSWGGNIYESGGAPGAEMFVRFRGVTDKASADKLLQALMPDLEKLVKSF